MPLVKRASTALEVGCRELTNRVGVGHVWDIMHPKTDEAVMILSILNIEYLQAATALQMKGVDVDSLNSRIKRFENLALDLRDLIFLLGEQNPWLRGGTEFEER